MNNLSSNPISVYFVYKKGYNKTDYLLSKPIISRYEIIFFSDMKFIHFLMNFIYDIVKKILSFKLNKNLLFWNKENE